MANEVIRSFAPHVDGAPIDGALDCSANTAAPFPLKERLYRAQLARITCDP